MTNDDKLLEIRAAVERYCMTYGNRSGLDDLTLICKILEIFGIHSDGKPVASRVG